MDAINQNWFSANTGRRYPVDDSATGEDDTGASLPDDILVDLSVRAPSSVGNYLFVGGVNVSSGAVAVVILASNTYSGIDPAPVATFSMSRSSLQEGKVYPLQAMATGVAGWISFGPGTNFGGANYSGKFSTPHQAKIAPRCGQVYRASPVTSFGKVGVTGMSGLVRLSSGPDLLITRQTRVIEGEEKQAIIFALKRDAARNVYEEYRGPCTGRPESGTCDGIGFRSLAGVTPDCEGNINLVVQGADLKGSEGLLVIDYNVDINDACPAKYIVDSDGKLPGQEDSCLYDPYQDEADSSTVPPGSDSSEAPEPEPEPSYESSGACEELPYSTDFGDGIAHRFQLISGSVSSSVLESTTDESIVTTDAFDVCNIVWDGCAYESVMCKTVKCHLFFPPSTGIPQVGGIVLNWRMPTLTTQSFMLAGLNWSTSKLVVYLWNGSTLVPFLESSTLGINADNLYEITVHIGPSTPGNVYLEVHVLGLDDAVSGTLSFTTSESFFGSVAADNQAEVGLFGLGSFRARVAFNYFSVEENVNGGIGCPV